MNIAFFGSSLLSSYWNGAATYYRGIIRQLYQRGHHITFYEPDAYDRQMHRDMDPPDWANCVIYENSETSALLQVESASQADLVIKASGVGVFDELLERAVLEMRRPGQIVIFWDVDAPATLDRIIQTPHDHLRSLVPLYDAILTYGGGMEVVYSYRRLGARECIPIYNGVDPETHFPTHSTSRYQVDLSFIGNRLPDREKRVEEFFLKAAQLRPEMRFLLGGNGWHDKSVPANVVKIGHVGTKDHNEINCSARAVLNINRESMARFGFSPPTRVFEAAGAGACLITDAWEGIEEFFEPGQEILVARNGEEVAELTANLTHEQANAIGQAALYRVLSKHTYSCRADQFEEIFVTSAL